MRPLYSTPATFRRVVTRTLYELGRMTGAFTLARWLQRRFVPILCYHSVVNQPLPPWLAAGGLHLPVERFRDQLRFLARHYRVIPLEDIVNAIATRRDRLPPRSVALTFDDGYANNLTLAAPMLAEFGFPATVFLATDYIGRDGLYWWDEAGWWISAGLGCRLSAEAWGTLDLTTTAGIVRALERSRELLAAATLEERDKLLAALAAAVGPVPAGPPLEILRPARWEECRAAPPNIRFGGHGASHRLLDRLYPDEAQADLERCAHVLRVQLGARTAPVFCYPGGRCAPLLRTQLSAVRFAAAVTASHTPRADRLAAIDSDPTLLPRLGITTTMTLAAFAGALTGVRGVFFQRSLEPGTREADPEAGATWAPLAR